MSMLKDKPEGWVKPAVSKMYLLIKDSITFPDKAGFQVIDVGHAVNGAAHAGAMIASRWPRQRIESKAAGWMTDEVMVDWYDQSFRKVCCKVNEQQFEKAKTYFPPEEWFAVTESHFEGAEIILVFKPRTEWPEFFKSLKLYR